MRAPRQTTHNYARRLLAPAPPCGFYRDFMRLAGDGDFTIATDDSELGAHLLILGARSPYCLL
jgi:hypothetical protein